MPPTYADELIPIRYLNDLFFCEWGALHLELSAACWANCLTKGECRLNSVLERCVAK